MISLIELPRDIWDEIFGYVDCDSLLRFRTVSRKLREQVERSRVWKRMTRERWFKVVDMNVEEFMEVENYFGYFQQRRQLDMAVEELVVGARRVNSVDSRQQDGCVKAYMEKLWKVCEYGDRAVPRLLQMKEQLAASVEQRLGNLQTYYVVDLLLRSLRTKKAFEYVYKVIITRPAKDEPPAEPLAEPLEELFFRLSYLDPAFDSLVMFRTRLVDAIVADVRTKQRNGYVESNTHTIIYILRRFFALSLQTYRLHLKKKHVDPNVRLSLNASPPSLQDISLLRVYCGEAKGSTVILLAIIQNIARLVGIRCTVTWSLLVVDDDTFEDNKACIFVHKPKVQIFNYSKVRASIEGRPTALNNTLKPVSFQDALKYYFGYDFPSITELVHSTDGSSPDDVNQALFPVSGIDMKPSDLQYYRVFYRLLTAFQNLQTLCKSGAATVSELHQLSLLCSNLQHSFQIELQLAHFTDLPCLKECWPFFFPHDDSSLHSVNTQFSQHHHKLLKQQLFASFEQICVSRYGICRESPCANSTSCPTATKRLFVVGDLVYHQRWAIYGVIVGWKYLQNNIYDHTGELLPSNENNSPQPNLVFYNVYLIDGTVGVFSQESLQNGFHFLSQATQNGPMVQNTVLEQLSRGNLLGLFMDHYDKTHARFVPTRFIKNLFPSL